MPASTSRLAPSFAMRRPYRTSQPVRPCPQSAGLGWAKRDSTHSACDRRVCIGTEIESSTEGSAVGGDQPGL
jgi:hypothetical protein